MTPTMPAPLISSHQHCEDLLANALTTLADGDWAQALESLSACRRHAVRHMEAEEADVFPRLVENVPELTHALAQCRTAHDEIRTHLQAALAAVGEQDAAGGTIMLMHLAGLFAYHRRMEEQLLYAHAPALDTATLTVLTASTGPETGSATRFTELPEIPG